MVRPLLFLSIILLIFSTVTARGHASFLLPSTRDEGDSTNNEGIKDRKGDFMTEGDDTGPFDLDDPESIDKTVEYDPESQQYIIKETIGERFFRDPKVLSFEEFLEIEGKKSRSQYWDQLSDASSNLNKRMKNPVPAPGCIYLKQVF